MTTKAYPNDLEVYRKRMRLSQKQIAHFLGHSDTSSLSRLERGRSLPNLHTALRLAAIYRVPVDFLYSRLYITERDQIRSLENEASEKWQSGNKSLTSKTHAPA